MYIYGATIGRPESASVTDIFGGQFIDPIVKLGGPLEPRFWKRYRDDSFDIVWGENAMEGKLQEFTDYLNNNVLKGRIVFELELNTLEPHGLNSANEYENAQIMIRAKKIGKRSYSV